MKVTELVINEYQIEGGRGARDMRNITLRRQPQRHGPDKWAIYDGQSIVLDKDGDWQFEPLPSSRTEEYLRLCRFDSAEEALAFYEQLQAAPGRAPAPHDYKTEAAYLAAVDKFNDFQAQVKADQERSDEPDR